MRSTIVYFLTVLLLFFTKKTFSQDAISVPLGQEMLGVASFYDLPGNQTASGETMLKGGYTCAHRWYPFGTMLEVTNLTNNKWVVVRVTDRGPFSGGRMLDLSMEAAKTIGMVHIGTVKIKTVVVGDNGQIFITRPAEAIIEKAIAEKVDDNKEAMPLTSKTDDEKKQKEKENDKKVVQKRNNRRKN